MDFLLQTLAQYGIAFVFAMVLVEQLGAPIPAFPVIMLGGTLAARGELALAPLFAAAMAATLIADNLWYWAGARLGRRVLRLMCQISLTPDGCVRQTESIFLRFGPASLIVAKFVPGFASVSTALSGALHIRRSTFVLFDAIGSALWIGLALALGWLFAPAIAEVLSTLEELGRWGLALLLAAVLAFVASKWWQRRQFQRQLSTERISVDALTALMDGGETAVLVDVRVPGSLPHGRIPGALQMHGKNLPAELDPLARDTLLVVYCACPNEVSAVLAAQQLRRRGFTRVLPLLGGVDAWLAAGRPLASA